MFGQKENVPPAYDPAAQKPVLRCSICTGEQVAGFLDLHTGHFTEVQLIRSPQELQAFRSRYGIPPTAPLKRSIEQGVHHAAGTRSYDSEGSLPISIPPFPPSSASRARADW